MNSARIYCPAKTAMQSGRRNTRKWVLEFEPTEPKTPDPIMGWAGSGDMEGQIRLKFNSCEEAETYAKAKGIFYHVMPQQKAKLHIKGYADNFK